MSIEYIANPSEELQLIAVNHDGRCLAYIRNPTPAVQMAAVKNWSTAIKYVADPCPEMQLMAVLQNYSDIRHIAKPTEEAQLVAVIRHTENKRRHLFEFDFLDYVNEPCYAARLATAGQWSWAVSLIPDLSEELQLMVMRMDPEAYHMMANPSPVVQNLYRHMTRVLE